jgi:hypothetical protein
MCPFQFLVFYSVFFPWAGVRLSRELCWFIPGVAAGVPHAAYLLTHWSVSPKQVRSWHLMAQEPSWFLCVTWHGEAMCGLGVPGVGFLPLLGGFSCQVYLQHLSKIFVLQSSCYLLPPSSWHLGTSCLFFLMVAILISVIRNLSIILICNSFMDKDIEHFFMYLLAMDRSFENCLVKSLPILLIRFLIFLVF